jgi:hypothetical protein
MSNCGFWFDDVKPGLIPRRWVRVKAFSPFFSPGNQCSEVGEESDFSRVKIL